MGRKGSSQANLAFGTVSTPPLSQPRPLRSNTGDVCGFGSIAGSFDFSWTLKNFSKLNATATTVGVTSQQLFPNESLANWYLTVVPLGGKDTGGEFVSCFVSCSDAPEAGIGTKWTIRLLNVENRTIRRHEENWYSSVSGSRRGLEKFVDRKSLLADLPDDVLIVSVNITFSLSTTTQNDSYTDFTDVSPLLASSENMSCLFKNPVGNDFVVSVRGSEIPVHSAILCAHSPVFRKMFEHDMLESVDGRVEVDDVDLHVMKLFLEFLYRGGTDLSDTDTALDVLKVADKYSVDYLKIYCTNFLIARFSTDNIAQMIVTADALNAGKLKRRGIEFFYKNKSTFDFDKYQSLLQQRPAILIDIIKFMPK